MGKKWSETDVEILKNNFYSTDKNQLLDWFPNRSWGATKGKALKLGLKRFKNFWKMEEDNLIRQHYINGKRDVILKLLPGRDWAVIKKRAQFLRIKRKIRSDGYTKEDVIFILDNYLHMPYRDIAAKIGKNQQSVEDKINHLRLTHKLDLKHNKWSSSELEIIKKNYEKSSEETILKLLPGRSWESIKALAKRLKIKRSPEFRLNAYHKIWLDKDYLSEHSDRMKRLWSDHNHRNSMRIKTKNQWKNKDFRKNLISKIKLKWKDPSYARLQAEKLKNLWKNPEYRKKMSELSKMRWKDPICTLKYAKAC